MLNDWQNYALNEFYSKFFHLPVASAMIPLGNKKSRGHLVSFQLAATLKIAVDDTS